MQKLLAWSASALLTFFLGVGAAKLLHIGKSSQSPKLANSLANVSDAEVHFRCEKNPELPSAIKFKLDRGFPGWKFPDVNDEDCQDVKRWGGSEAHPELIQGDFNGDERTDYAVLILKQNRAPDTTKEPDEFDIVAFLGQENGQYQMRLVTREAGTCLQLMRKGDADYNYEAGTNFTYSHDTIFSGEGMGGTSYVYEKGKFRSIITSD